MPYPEIMIKPMRDELVRVGFEELRTAEQVDDAINNTDGTVMIVVNSVCGCAAGKARPGIAKSLTGNVRPDRLATVFAGADIDATERARAHFTGVSPSSPAVAIMRDGKLVYMMPRSVFEVSSPDTIASTLAAAYEQYCVKAESSVQAG